MKRQLFGFVMAGLVFGAAAPLLPAISSQGLHAETIPAATRTGAFVTVEQDHATTGTARIVTEGDQRYIEFDSAFDTARGPAVYVVLHRNNTVPVSLNEADYVTLAPLQSFTGAQRYAIPEAVNLADYQSVAIWCEEFNVTFGYAPLT